MDHALMATALALDGKIAIARGSTGQLTEISKEIGKLKPRVANAAASEPSKALKKPLKLDEHW